MSEPIPRVFHFVFGLKPQTEPFHLAFYLCLESCRQVNRPEGIWFHYEHEPFGPYWDLIKPHLTLNRVSPVPQVSLLHYDDPSVKRLYSYAHHADFIRLEQLLEHGGVYADMDTLFVNPIPETLWRHDFVLGREDPVKDERTGEMRASICNALIMSRPRAEFGTIWLREMPAALDGVRWTNHSCQLANEIWERHPHLVHVEPARTFYKHMWTPEGLRVLFEGLDSDFSGVASMHLWSHLWWSRWRRDFVTFHAGSMTEHHVRTVDTTYNVAARPFLPTRGAISLLTHLRASVEGVMRRARRPFARAPRRSATA